MPEGNDSTEIWKPIPKFEGWYEVSNKGRIKRVKPAFGARPGRIMKATLDKKGYPYVSLCKRAEYTRRPVHQFVMAAFAGPCPKGHEVNHIHRPVTDNRWPENLEYVTHQENVEHARKSGFIPRGERHYKAKLTEEMVRQIRHSTESETQLGRRFGLSAKSAGDVRRGRIWKHVV